MCLEVAFQTEGDYSRFKRKFTILDPADPYEMVAMVMIQPNKDLSWGMATLASSPTKDLNSDCVSSKVCYWGSGQAEWATWSHLSVG